MRAIPAIAERQFGVFSRQQALRAGWTRSALLHAVRSGQLCRLQPGAFASSEILAGNGPAADRRRLAAMTAGALLITPAAVASHASAAVLADLPSWRVPARPCLTVAPQRTGDASGLHLHRAGLPLAHLRRAGAFVRTSAARTIVDIGREHGVEDAIVTADAALHGGTVSMDDLVRCLVDCARWPGIRRARAAIGLTDARSESPLESVSRLRIAATNLPAPELQTEISDVHGRRLGRVDFYWDDAGVVGEVDGKIKYTDGDDDALWNEKLRQERFEETGLIVVRWGRAQLDDVARLAGRLRAAFARGARRADEDRRWIARPTPLFAPW